MSKGKCYLYGKIIDKRGIGFRILARNLPIEFKCKICGKRQNGFFQSALRHFAMNVLKSMPKKKDMMQMSYPTKIVNSPRCGVCGYVGSEKYGDI